MKKLCLFLLLACQVLTAFGESANVSDFFKFKKMPWHCVVVVSRQGRNDLSKSIYYYPDGRIKAYGIIRDDGSYNLYVLDYYKKDDSHENYEISGKFDEKGRLIKTGRRQPFHPDIFRNLGGSYWCKDDSIDKYGNWTVSGASQIVITRQLRYYDDESYDAQEDALLDELIAEAPKLGQKVDAKIDLKIAISTLCSLPLLPLAGLIPLTLICLFMLLFRKRQLYDLFDNYAGEKITPIGAFSKLQLQGIIPVTLYAGPIYIGMLLFQNIFAYGLAGLAGIVLCGLYCRWWIRRKSSEMPICKAKAMLVFAIVSVCVAIGSIVLSVVLLLGYFLLKCLGYGLNASLGSLGGGEAGDLISGGNGGSGSEASCINCSYCSDYRYCTRYNRPVSPSDSCSSHRF